MRTIYSNNNDFIISEPETKQPKNYKMKTYTLTNKIKLIISDDELSHIEIEGKTTPLGNINSIMGKLIDIYEGVSFSDEEIADNEDLYNHSY